MYGRRKDQIFLRNDFLDIRNMNQDFYSPDWRMEANPLTSEIHSSLSQDTFYFQGTRKVGYTDLV